MKLIKRMKIQAQDGRTYRISLYRWQRAYIVEKDQPWTEWDYPWENNNGWRMVMMLSEPGLHAAIKEYYRMAKSCLKY